MLSLLHIPAGDGLLQVLAWQMQLGMAGLAVICLFAFAVGACLGSFANACAMRLVRDEDFIFAKSRCRGCDRPLSWWQNLPLIGWLTARGRCTSCGSHIGFRYLLVEILMGLVLVAYIIMLPTAMVIGFTLALALVAIACLTDFEAMTLHPLLLSILGLAGLLLAVGGQTGFFAWHLTSGQALLGAILTGGLPFVINAGFRRLRGTDGFGEGDFWLMAAIGAWLGPFAGVALFVVASWLGATAGIVLMITSKATIATRLPFGLFAGGAFILWPNLFTRVF
ncbi:MAG: prepilin peptidase [Candidatus Puniceispirillaceae bacterium]